MKKDIHLYQGVNFKLVGAQDIDPRDVLPGAISDNTSRTSGVDPSIGDIARVSDESATVVYIEGYSSVFLNPDGSRLEDRDGESVNIALLDIENYKNNPILCYNHNWGDVMGKVTEIRKDAKGLYVRAEVHKLTGRESVFESVQKGLVVTFSIGFVPKKFTYLEDEDIFEISSAELVEISLAPVPSNQDALFIATSQKALRLNKDMVKEQTKMTCDELTGICTPTKSIKGKKMADEVKVVVPAKEVAPEVVVPAKEVVPEVVVPAKEVVPEVVVPAKEVVPEKVDPMSVNDLADAIAQANEAAEIKKAEKLANEVAEQTALEEAAKLAATNRVKDSLLYIKERKETIEATDASDIDPDELADFYELLSDTVETIDSKIIEAAKAIA